MWRFLILFFLFFYISCLAPLTPIDNPVIDLNNSAYQNQTLSFRSRGSYNIKSFILSLTRSSLLKETLSSQERTLFSLGGLVFSDQIESILSQSLNLRYNHAKAYSVEYKTISPYTNRQITASGLVLMPSTNRPLPLLVYFYPTLLDKSWAPSLIPSSLLSMDPIEDYRPMLIFLALQGYIVLVPDLIGYGSSEKEPHPYLHKASTAQTTSHFFQSVINILNKENISIKRDLFIMGYSQGGHAALSFSEAVQNSSTNFEIKAVSAGGGPYDLLYTSQELLNQREVLKLTVGPLLQSFSYLYNWNLNHIVKKESYASAISQIYKWNNLERAVQAFPNQVNSLFRSSFLDDIYSKQSNFYQHTLEKNSVYNWNPRFPVLLFHLKDDTVVPYRNKDIAYRALSYRNSQIKKVDCDFKRIEDLIGAMGDLSSRRGDRIKYKPDHINCHLIHFLETGDYFSRYRN